MFLEKSDLSVGMDKITRETAFDESYYREICGEKKLQYYRFLEL